jgi:hypothetical protein
MGDLEKAMKLNGPALAEKLPPSIESDFFNHPFPGSVEQGMAALPPSSMRISCRGLLRRERKKSTCVSEKLNGADRGARFIGAQAQPNLTSGAF